MSHHNIIGRRMCKEIGLFPPLHISGKIFPKHFPGHYVLRLARCVSRAYDLQLARSLSRAYDLQLARSVPRAQFITHRRVVRCYVSHSLPGMRRGATCGCLERSPIGAHVQRQSTQHDLTCGSPHGRPPGVYEKFPWGPGSDRVFGDVCIQNPRRPLEPHPPISLDYYSHTLLSISNYY